MKLLIVEDEDLYINVLKDIVSQYDPKAECSFVQSKESALGKIEGEFFDLILLDLNIPTVNGAQDGDPAHGHAVFAQSRVVAPGTPVIVLTGSSAEEFIPSLVEHSNKIDVWGEGAPVQMVTFHAKHKLDSFPMVFGTYASQILKLKEVELKRNGIELSDSEDRLIRIFTRQFGGTKASIFQIGGGLSSAKVFRLNITNSAGVLVHHAICKIGSPETIKDEDIRYKNYVARLSPEATPRLLAVLEHGAKKTSGVFYGLAEGCELNAFNYVDTSKNPEQLIFRLESLLNRWVNPGESRRSVQDIRRMTLNDNKYQEVLQYVPWSDEFERHPIQVRWGVSHGDLHGLNILISNNDFPVLIDYGDIKESPSCFDPITLELSLFFHPDGPLKNSTWPTNLQASNWGDLTVYLNGCPYPDFVRSCRQWALRIAAGEREVASVAYAYLMRQLKYPDVNRDRVLALLTGAKAYYDQT